MNWSRNGCSSDLESLAYVTLFIHMMTLPYVVIQYPWVVLALPVYLVWVKDPDSPVFFLNFLSCSPEGMNIHDWKYARVFFSLCFVILFFFFGVFPNVIPSCARLFSISVGLRLNRRVGAV